MKKILSCLFALTTLAVLSSCSSKGLSEDKLKEAVSEKYKSLYVNYFDSDDETRELNVKSFTVDKQLTEGSKDTAYCTIVVEDDCYHIEYSVEVDSTKYNDGWQIDSIYSTGSNYQLLSVPYSGSYDFSRDGELVSYEDYVMDNHSVVSNYTYMKEHANGNEYITYNTVSTFDGNKWEVSETTSDTDIEWNITGNWSITEECPATPKWYEHACSGFINIDSFDSSTYTATGIAGGTYRNGQYLNGLSTDISVSDMQIEEGITTIEGKPYIEFYWKGDNERGSTGSIYVDFYLDFQRFYFGGNSFVSDLVRN